MLAGVFQSNGGGLTPQVRLEKLATVLAENTLDLIVCPELFLSGYNVPDELPKLAQAPDSALCEQVTQLARQNNTAIIYGYPEREGDFVYNTAACISAQGKLIAKHRKMLLPPGHEVDLFTAGNKYTLFELGGFRCGLLICYEVEFPETVRALVQAGAQLVIVPTALYDNWGVITETLVPTRALENGVWLIYANHAGVENGRRYFGSSCIVSPEGKDAARAGSQEQPIIAQLDLERVVAARQRLPYLPDLEDFQNRLKE